LLTVFRQRAEHGNYDLATFPARNDRFAEKHCGVPRGFTISLLKPCIEPPAAQLKKLFGKPHKLKVSVPPRESQC